MDCNIVQEAMTKTIPKEKEMQEHTVVWGGLTKEYLRKEEKGKANEKGKAIPSLMQSSREWQGEIKKAS